MKFFFAAAVGALLVTFPKPAHAGFSLVDMTTPTIGDPKGQSAMHSATEAFWKQLGVTQEIEKDQNMFASWASQEVTHWIDKDTPFKHEQVYGVLGVGYACYNWNTAHNLPPMEFDDPLFKTWKHSLTLSTTGGNLTTKISF